jgi:hypothetical protein
MVHISVYMFLLLLCKIMHFNYKLRNYKITQKEFNENGDTIIILIIFWLYSLLDYYYKPK